MRKCMEQRSAAGFTLVEIMIAVTILAALAAVAIPNFVRYRKTSQMNTCIGNLKEISTAYDHANMAGKTPSEVEDLCGPGQYLRSVPICPASRTNSYSLPTEGHGNPTCSNSTEEYPHKLP